MASLSPTDIPALPQLTQPCLLPRSAWFGFQRFETVLGRKGSPWLKPAGARVSVGPKPSKLHRAEHKPVIPVTELCHEGNKHASVFEFSP